MCNCAVDLVKIGILMDASVADHSTLSALSAYYKKTRECNSFCIACGKHAGKFDIFYYSIPSGIYMAYL